MKQDSEKNIALEIALFRRAIRVLSTPDRIALQEVLNVSEIVDGLSIDIPLLEFSPFDTIHFDRAVGGGTRTDADRVGRRHLNPLHRFEDRELSLSAYQTRTAPVSGRRETARDMAGGPSKRVGRDSPHRAVTNGIGLTAGSHPDKPPTRRADTYSESSGATTRKAIPATASSETVASHLLSTRTPFKGERDLVNIIQMIDEVSRQLERDPRVIVGDDSERERDPGVIVGDDSERRVDQPRENSRRHAQMVHNREVFTDAGKPVRDRRNVLLRRAPMPTDDRVDTPVEMRRRREDNPGRLQSVPLREGMTRIEILAEEIIRQDREQPTRRNNTGRPARYQQSSETPNQDCGSDRQIRDSISQPDIGDAIRETSAERQLEVKDSETAVPIGTDEPVKLEHHSNDRISIDKDSITNWVNEVLVEQARRHGVDLS